MMGRLEGGAAKLFYEFSLEDMVPTDHMLRKIDRFLNFDDLRAHLKPFYSHTGRPSIDPELMVRMLIVGYCFGIRSERRLCDEVHLNLAYRWFCKLGIEDTIPSHSTFSKARHGRFRESDLFRKLFESTVTRCMAEGLVRGEGFATDASIVKADVNRERTHPGEEPIDWTDPKLATRPVAEYLDGLEQENSPRKVISLTDPGARWTAIYGKALFAWSTNYLIDVEAGVIMDVEPTPSTHKEEVASTRLMIDRTHKRFGIKPDRLMGDTAYGASFMLDWLVKKRGIAPHIPVWEKKRPHKGVFGRDDYKWDADNNRFVCPAGKFLTTTGKPTAADTYVFRSRNLECAVCPMKPDCCPTTPSKKLTRSIYEEARNVARAIAKTDAYVESRKERKKVEMLFAHLKRILKLDRLRLRGRSGARDEFLLAATAQNLRKLAKRIPSPEPKYLACP